MSNPDEKYGEMPMYTVLNPEGEHQGYEKADARIQETYPALVVSSTSYCPGEHTFDDAVLAEARRRGIEPTMIGGDVFFADWIVEPEDGPAVEDPPSDMISRFDAAGITLAKLPDRIGSEYYRWYACEKRFHKCKHCGLEIDTVFDEDRNEVVTLHLEHGGVTCGSAAENCVAEPETNENDEEE